MKAIHLEELQGLTDELAEFLTEATREASSETTQSFFRAATLAVERASVLLHLGRIQTLKEQERLKEDISA